jgi:hypothetical protein
VVRIRIGVVACEILKREIDKVIENDPDIVHKEYLDFGLHTEPEKMKYTIIEKLNALEGRVDAVLLGYAICQSLKGVTKEVKVPTVMLEGDDCIATLLTPVGYEEEKRIVTGTWFNSPGWAELGIKGAIRELHLDSMVDQGYDPMYFLRILFEGYGRCLFIDTGVGEGERFEGMSKDFAKELNLVHHSRTCSLALIEVALRDAKKLGAQEIIRRGEGVAVLNGVTT